MSTQPAMEVVVMTRVACKLPQIWLVMKQMGATTKTPRKAITPREQQPSVSQTKSLLILLMMEFCRATEMNPAMMPSAIAAPMLLLMPAIAPYITPPDSTEARMSRRCILSLKRAEAARAETTPAERAMRVQKNPQGQIMRRLGVLLRKKREEKVKARKRKKAPRRQSTELGQLLWQAGSLGLSLRKKLRRREQTAAKTQTMLIWQSSKILASGELFCSLRQRKKLRFQRTLQKAVEMTVWMMVMRPMMLAKATSCDMAQRRASCKVMQLVVTEEMLQKESTIVCWVEGTKVPGVMNWSMNTLNQKLWSRGESTTVIDTTRRTIVRPVAVFSRRQLQSRPKPSTTNTVVTAKQRAQMLFRMDELNIPQIPCRTPIIIRKDNNKNPATRLEKEDSCLYSFLIIDCELFIYYFIDLYFLAYYWPNLRIYPYLYISINIVLIESVMNINKYGQHVANLPSSVSNTSSRLAYTLKEIQDRGNVGKIVIAAGQVLKLKINNFDLPPKNITSDYQSQIDGFSPYSEQQTKSKHKMKQYFQEFLSQKKHKIQQKICFRALNYVPKDKEKLFLTQELKNVSTKRQNMFKKDKSQKIQHMKAKSEKCFERQKSQESISPKSQVLKFKPRPLFVRSKKRANISKKQIIKKKDVVCQLGINSNQNNSKENLKVQKTKEQKKQQIKQKVISQYFRKNPSAEKEKKTFINQILQATQTVLQRCFTQQNNDPAIKFSFAQQQFNDKNCNNDEIKLLKPGSSKIQRFLPIQKHSIFQSISNLKRIEKEKEIKKIEDKNKTTPLSFNEAPKKKFKFQRKEAVVKQLINDQIIEKESFSITQV